LYLFYLFFALIAERRVVRLWYNPILIVVRNLADQHPRMRGFGSARLRKKIEDKKSMVERLWLFILCFASINCKCFNQLLKGEIYANLNNLTASRINLSINLKDSSSINCKCFNQLLKGEIYANLNNLTAFRINLSINLKDSWPSNFTSLLMVVEALQPNAIEMHAFILCLNGNCY
jgi:hypothetical protein